MEDRTSPVLVFLCEHSAGALGLVVNKPSDINLQRLFDKVELRWPRRPASLAGLPRRPGADRARLRAAQLCRRRRATALTLPIPARHGHDHLQGLLEAVARGEGRAKMLVSLGYSGWAGARWSTN